MDGRGGDAIKQNFLGYNNKSTYDPAQVTLRGIGSGGALRHVLGAQIDNRQIQQRQQQQEKMMVMIMMLLLYGGGPAASDSSVYNVVNRM